MIQNGLKWCTFLLVVYVTLLVDAASVRERRDLFQLEEVIYDGTGLNALTYLNGYGCYCGWGGSGRPVNGIDECCMIHDNCYGNVTAKSQDTCKSKWMHYRFTTAKTLKGPIHNIIKCLDKDDPDYDAKAGFQNTPYCHHQICLCDKGLTECVEKYKKVYTAQPKKGCIHS